MSSTADNTSQARPIEIGEAGSDNAVVLKGVSAGDRVVTAGQYRLQNGALVAATAASAAPAGTGTPQ